MDKLTDIIRQEIRNQFKSVRQFANQIGIAYTTIDSALKKGVSGTSFVSVMKMCDALSIRCLPDGTPFTLKANSIAVADVFSELDEQGQLTVMKTLSDEHARCKKKEEELRLAAFSGRLPDENAQVSEGEKAVQDILRKIRQGQY